MPTSVIGALRVSLGLDSAQFSSGTARAQAQAATFAGRMKKQFAAVEQSGRALGGVVSALAGPLAAISGVAGAAGLIALADQAKTIEAQLKLATAQTGSFAQAQQDVARIATGTRGGLAETATLYGNFVRSTAEMGKSQTDAARATETFSKALKIGGADASAAAGATLQFGQALASGVLRGDEFNSVNEASPRIMRLLADSLGIPIGQLRSMAEEGKLTSDILFKALTDRKFTTGIDAEFAQLPVTIDQALTLVNNAAIATFGAFDRGGGFSTALATFVGDGADGFESLAGRAEQFGIDTRVVFDGLANVFDPIEANGNAVFDALGIKILGVREQIQSILDSIDRFSNIDATIENGVKRGLNRAIDRAGGGKHFEETPLADYGGRFRRGTRQSHARSRVDSAARRLEGQGYVVPRNADGTVNEAGIRRADRPTRRTTGVKVDADVAKYQEQIADLEKLKANASGKELKTIQAQIDRRQRILGNLRQGVGIEAARAAAGGRGSVRSTDAEAKKLAREAERAAAEKLREDRRYAGLVAQERDAELRARADLTVEAADRLSIEKQLRDNEIAARLDAISTDKDLTAERKAALSALIKQTAALEDQVATRRAEQEQAQRNLEAAQAGRQNQTDILSAQASLARTVKERGALELKILNLQFEQQRAVQEAVIASQTSTAEDKQKARDRLATLSQLQSLGRAQVERENAGPLASYLDSLPRSGAEVSEALENVGVKGLDSLIDGVATLKGGFEELADTVSDAAKRIIADLAKIALQRGLVALLGRFLPGSGGTGTSASGGAGTGAFDIGSFVGQYGIAGARANGGPTVGGRNYLIGERGPEIWTAPGSGHVIANDDIPIGGGAMTIHAPLYLTGAVDLATRTEARQYARAHAAEVAQAMFQQNRRRPGRP